jgi:Ulp1 family protease
MNTLLQSTFTSLQIEEAKKALDKKIYIQMLEQFSLDRVSDKEWLDVDAITVYMNLLSTVNKSIQYINMDWIQYIQSSKSDKEELNRILGEPKWGQSSIYLMPINHGGSHFTLFAVLSIGPDTEPFALFFDSLNNSSYYRDFVNNMLIPLQRYDKCPSTLRAVNPANIDRVNAADHQKDGSSCGVFTCMYAEAIAMGMLPSSIENMSVSTYDISMYREKLHRVLSNFASST